jgi:DNA polymerase
VTGEAPGTSEDIFGQPFFGPAGDLLDKMITEACQTVKAPRIAFTNIVACIPLEETIDVKGHKHYEKTKEPDKKSIEACRPRFVEIVRICRPRLLIRAGKLAQQYVVGPTMFREDGKLAEPEWIPKGQKLELVDIIHPAAITRMDIVQQPLAIKRTVVSLIDAFSKL